MEKTSKVITFDNVGVTYVTQHEMPICCPPLNKPLWNAHPRVYLPIMKTGKATCPYCSALYVLEGFKKLERLEN